MSACPSLTLSCDNLSCNIWFCCGSAKDPEPYPPTQSHVVTAPYYEPPSELVPPHQVSSPAPAPPPAMQAPYYQPPSELVPPHHVSPAPAPQAPSTVTTPHVPVPPCNRARGPPAPAATPIPAAVPSKRYEPPQPAPRPPVPPNETPVQWVMPMPARLPSKKYEPPTPQAPPPVTVTSQPSARTTWPPRVKSKTYDDVGVPPAVSLPSPSTPIAPRAHGSRYPPAPHPHLGDTEPRIESFSQAASLHQEYY